MSRHDRFHIHAYWPLKAVRTFTTDDRVQAEAQAARWEKSGAIVTLTDKEE